MGVAPNVREYVLNAAHQLPFDELEFRNSPRASVLDAVECSVLGGKSLAKAAGADVGHACGSLARPALSLQEDVEGDPRSLEGPGPLAICHHQARLVEQHRLRSREGRRVLALAGQLMNRLLGTSHPEDDVASLRSAFGNLPRVSEPFTSAEHHHYNLILVRNAYALWQSHFDRLTAACLLYSLSDLHKFTHGVFCELDGHRVLSISNADIHALASVSIGATGRRVKPEPLRRPETSRPDAVCAQHVPEHQSVTSQEGDSPLVFRACELDGRRLRYKETKAPKSSRIPGPYGAEHRV